MNKFWAILAANFYFKKTQLSWTATYEFLPFQNLGKTNYPIPREYPGRWKDRRIERTLFYRILSATPRCSKSKDSFHYVLNVNILNNESILKLLHFIYSSFQFE